MYRRKKKVTKMTIFIGIIVVILLVSLSVLLPKDNFINKSLLKDVTVMLNKIVMYPFTTLTKEKDTNHNESYVIQKNVNESLEKEIQELKDALELNKTLTEYTPINATILSRNKSYWYNTITIDKGKKDGITEDMAVITSKGLVGKISSVSLTSSEVKLITSDDINFKVSIAINTNDVDNFAILNGYDKKTNLIKATGIDKTTHVNIGDKVLTSGLGKKFPAGIYIGTVEKIESDKYNLSKTVHIKTYQNFNDIHYVTVLKVK